MKCIILAAGYATRLYPLTKNFPKPLLKVKGKAIIEWMLEDIQYTGLIDEIFIVTNHRFYSIFSDWLEDWNNREKTNNKINICIIDDYSTNNDDRKGAVRDIAYVIENCDLKNKVVNTNDGILVVAGDNLLDFSIKGFLNFYKSINKTCIMRYFEPDIKRLQRTGVVTVDTNNKVISMKEKPEKPESNWAVPPYYIYSPEDLDFIVESVNNLQMNLDAPGGFIEWFCKSHDVFAYVMPGNRYDIGDKESLLKAQNEYNGILITVD